MSSQSQQHVAPTHEAWNRFVATHDRGSLLQTTQWGALKAEFGWDWDLITVDADGRVGTTETPQAGALVLYRPLPLKLGTLAYIPRGPVVAWDNTALVETLLTAVHRTARRRRAWACWIEPEVREGAVPATQFTVHNYRPSHRTIQPRSTIVVDLTPSEDAIMAAMKSKTRYNIRLAGRKGVTVRQGTLSDIEIYHRLMAVTGERDAFGVHSEAYYRRAFELFAPEGQVALFIAEYEGAPLAGLLAFAVGKQAWYISGASSNRHRNLMPAYAVQWAAIRWAKSRGCDRYDLWGIPDASEEQLEDEFTERSDGLWGVYRFKRGFGGEIVRYVGLWERPLHPLYPLASRFYNTSVS